MRRAFTLQLHDAGNRHQHTCELCSEQFQCIDTKCPGHDTLDVCDRCITRHDCPECYEPMSLTWECDDSDKHGNPIRTTFSGICTCSTTARFLDLHDGRGALLVEYGHHFYVPPIHFHHCQCGSITVCEDSTGHTITIAPNGGRLGDPTTKCAGCDPSIKAAGFQ